MAKLSLRPQQSGSQPLALPPTQRFLPALLLLFVGSGCAALIYEIVWFQLIQLVIGSSAVSLGVLLGTFMGGMCLGSLLLPRFVSPEQHPLRVYAVLEAGIGVLGLIVLVVVPLVGGVVHGDAGPRASPAFCLRGVRLRRLSAAADAADGRDAAGDRALGRDDADGRVVARVLLRQQHRRRGVRLSARRLLSAARVRHGDDDVRRRRDQLRRRRRRLRAVEARAASAGRADARDDGSSAARRRRSNAIYVAIALSGLSALGAEVVWTRLLSLMLGASVYTFSIILAVFLDRAWIRKQRGRVHRARRSSRAPRSAGANCC